MKYLGTVSKRDKKTLILGGVISALLMGYQFVWTPLYSKTDMLKKIVTDQQRTIQKMQSFTTRIQQLKSSGAILPSQTSRPLLTRIDQAIQHDNLGSALTKITQKDKHVTVNFTDVAFDQLISWISHLWRQQSVGVEALTVNQAKTKGMVSALITLR